MNHFEHHVLSFKKNYVKLQSLNKLQKKLFG